MEKLTSINKLPIELIRQLLDANGISYKVYKDEFYNIEYEIENISDELCDKLEDAAIKLLSFWDNYEYDPDGNGISFIVGLPKGSIKKLIGRELTWEDDPFEI